MFPPRPVSPPPPACVTPALLDWQCSHLRFSCCSNICAAEDPARCPGSPLLGASSLVQGQDDVILKVGVVGADCVRQTNRFNFKKTKQTNNKRRPTEAMQAWDEWRRPENESSCDVGILCYPPTCGIKKEKILVCRRLHLFFIHPWLIIS